METKKMQDRRTVQYLSPSAVSKFYSNRDQYYLDYLALKRPPKQQQTPAMAVGSAFDSYVKSYLHDSIYGKGHKEAAKYDLTSLFEAQVEKQNRDVCLKIGEYLFLQYRASGALSDLMLELQGSVDDPTFEFEVKGEIGGTREGVEGKFSGVPMLGKPDLKFCNSEGCIVIFDFKVNNFYGKANLAPMARFVQCREQTDSAGWRYRGPHKDAILTKYKGLTINAFGFLEDTNEEWASQISVYGWLLGAEVGVENVVGVDQIVCNGSTRFGNYPALRIANHRTRISHKFQLAVMEKYRNLWDILTTEPFHYFRELSLAESQAKCALLDKKTEFYENLTDEEAEIIKWGTRSNY